MKRPPSLRWRIIRATGLLFGVVGSATLYTSFATAELARSVKLLFRGSVLVEDVRSGLVETSAALAGYLTSKSSDYLRDYMLDSSALADAAQGLNREVRPDETLLLQRELAGLVDRYRVDAQAAVDAKRGRDVPTYTRRFEDTVRSAELARFIVERVERLNLAASLSAWSGLDARVGAVVATNAALAVAAVLMAFMIFVRYSFSLTGPLLVLAEAARGVARGDYDRELPLHEAGDEIATVSGAFENMRASVRRSFEEIREKGEVERRLIEEELRLVDLDRRLKDAELLALQSQINPHFLFNTLSAGMQLALAEGADRTGDFMEQLAGFIRFALKSPSRSVSVAEEIENVGRYVWLLRLRFGARFAFAIEAADEALAMETPALLLQPLVENAVTHGLRNREEGGLVSVRAALEVGTLVFEVADNGAGMDAAVVERILREGLEPGDMRDAGGIGLHNVMRRVTLSTGGRGVFEIESEPGRGTLARIRLPPPEVTA